MDSAARDGDGRLKGSGATLHRVRRRFVSVVLILLATALCVLRPAPAAAATEARVAVGYDGYVLPGHSFPVRVEVTSDRLLRGRIEVTARVQNGPAESVTVEVPIEVPGGGAKLFTVVVPALPVSPGTTVQVSTQVRTGDKAPLATDISTARSADDRELVGVLPALAAGDLPKQVSLPMELGVAQLFALDPAALELGPGVIEPLGSIATTARDLSELTPRARRALLAWLEQGGTLLIDEAQGVQLAALPTEWQPTDDGVGTAGYGLVELTGGALAAGRWADVILPTPNRVVYDPRFFGGGFFGDVGNDIARDAGLRIPHLGWLLGALALYALVVGPVIGIVLNRRGQAELAWVAIPLAAVIFTTGMYAAAAGRRSSAKLAHSSVVAMSPAGETATSFIGLAARKRDEFSVGLPEGAWRARQNTSDFGGTGSGARTRLTGDGASVEMELSAGQFAVARLDGPTSTDAGLVVTASSDANGSATGVVRNSSSKELEEVAVFVGVRGVNVGRLAAGEEQAWSIQEVAPPGDLFMPAEARVWAAGRAIFDGRPRRGDSVVSLATWQAATPAAANMRPNGVAVAVGWSRKIDLRVSVDGSNRKPVGRTAVMATAPVEAAGAVTDLSSRGELVRPSPFGFGDGGCSGGLVCVVRLVLPAGASSTGLVASLPGGAEMWDGSSWVSVTPTGGGIGAPPAVGVRPVPLPAPPGQTATIFSEEGHTVSSGLTSDFAVPATAVRNRRIYVRLLHANAELAAGLLSLKVAL